MASRGRCNGHLFGAALVAVAVASAPVVGSKVTYAAETSSPSSAAATPEAPDGAARREANRARILDARLDALRDGLQLTAAQKPLWLPVAAAVHDVVEARGRRFRQRLTAVTNSIDALKMQGEHMAKVGAAMVKLADATGPLAGSLTSDQRDRLPKLFERVGPRKLLARAFGVPVAEKAAENANGSAGAPQSAVKASTPSAGPSNAAGVTSAPQKDEDDDD